MDDWELLRRYCEGDAEALEELLRRHMNLVYGTAKRLAGPDAEDVTQAVFILLAEKAKRLRPDGSLAGWLHSTTRWCSLNLRKTRAHRVLRERAAARQEVYLHSPEDGEAMACLDAGLASLDAVERNCILLRYVEQRSHAETGAALGVSVEAARKRSERGLEKLRRFFIKRGYLLALAAVVGLLERASLARACPQLAAQTAIAAIKGTGNAATQEIIGSIHRHARRLRRKWIAALGLTTALAAAMILLAWPWSSLNASRVPVSNGATLPASLAAASTPASARNAGIGVGSIAGRFVGSQNRGGTYLMRYSRYRPAVVNGRNELAPEMAVATTNANGEFLLEGLGFIPGEKVLPPLTLIVEAADGQAPHCTVTFDFELKDQALVRLTRDIVLEDNGIIHVPPPGP